MHCSIHNATACLISVVASQMAIMLAWLLSNESARIRQYPHRHQPTSNNNNDVQFSQTHSLHPPTFPTGLFHTCAPFPIVEAII